jgi:hypothetical protein|tara:strand:+ start:15283 stop:15537 length:255 start_codon:yes stop_codon:yes gene_type:complete
MTGGVGAREGARGVVRGSVVVVEIDRGDRGRARGGGMKARVRAPRRLGGELVMKLIGWKNSALGEATKTNRIFTYRLRAGWCGS